MTVFCNGPLCEHTAITANRAKGRGWAVLIVTVGGITPHPTGTIYLCPSCWERVKPSLLRPVPIAPLPDDLQESLGHHGPKVRDVGKMMAKGLTDAKRMVEESK